MTCYSKAIVILALFNAAVCTSIASTSLPLCTEGEEDDCTKCYDVLASQVVLSAKNRYNLQQAFFPPAKENPVFLEVIYKYDVNTTNGPIIESLNNVSEVWFWTDSGYYLYQPLDVIQFTSLFFADYTLRRSNVTIHLRQDCRNASEEHMQLFTQRLELYAMKQTIAAKIDDTYIPKAVSVGILKASHENAPSVHLSHISFSSQIVIPIVSFLLLLACWIYYWEVHYDASSSRRNKLTVGSKEGGMWTVQRHSVDVTVLSVLIASFTFCLYVFALDIVAMHHAVNTVDGYIKQYYNDKTGNTNFTLEYLTVFFISAADAIVLVLMFISFVVCGCISCIRERVDEKPVPNKDFWSFYVYLPLGPVMCIVIHGHHILIGFIHAPYHAGSVLIFYGIVILGFVFFYKAFHSTLAYYCCNRYTPQSDNDEEKDCCYICLFFLYSAISIIFCGLLVFIVTFFVLVPIDNAIDDAPSQLFSIERTVVVLLAVTVTYKIYSRKSHSLLTYILKAKDKRSARSKSSNENVWDYNWDKLEAEEKYVGIGTLLLDKLN